MPPGRGVPRAGFPVRCPFPSPCRAGVYARRTLLQNYFLKKYRCGGAKAPPYNTRQTPCHPGNGRCRTVSAGGMVAAPTHGPNAVTTKKRVRWVYGCGPHACGPYRPRSAPCSPYPGSRGVYLTCRSPFSSGRRPRNTTIFHFYFLIFNLNLNFSNFYFSRASSAAPMTPAR